jgi:NIMA-interacting peptidyl-prolyl cis-trans isomerase 1
MLSACTSLTTGPAWTHASLADSAPQRIASEEARLEAEFQARAREPKSIGAKHILIMHDKSERKPPEIHRTREEAKKRAEQALAKIRAGADFDAMVLQYTDEPGGAERKGDLGIFEKKTMVKAFGDAAFSLEVGQVSNVVETPFGFHVIKRTD